MNAIDPLSHFDFIGDIHGHATELKALLVQLGYTLQNGSYVHPYRKAFFVGDYIDRGPQIRETLHLVKDMVDCNDAIAIMGNHEYNALCFHALNKAGGHLRPHTITNLLQHYQTLKQFQNNQGEYDSWIEWFKTLPLFYETPHFRAVHACWDEQHIEHLRSAMVNSRLTDDLLASSVVEGTTLNSAIEVTLKGKEMALPDGVHFYDKDNTRRTEFRVRWWEDPRATTYRAISVHATNDIPEMPVDSTLVSDSNFYAAADKPVFFGHYWLNGTPMLFRDNICCLDYSVAKKGALVAYRFNNEEQLNSENIFIQPSAPC